MLLHTHTHCLTHNLAYTLPLSHTHSFSHTHSLSLSHTQTLSHTHQVREGERQRAECAKLARANERLASDMERLEEVRCLLQPRRVLPQCTWCSITPGRCSLSTFCSRGSENPLSRPIPTWIRCRANMAHIRQSRPDSGLGLSHFTGKKSVIRSLLNRWREMVAQLARVPTFVPLNVLIEWVQKVDSPTKSSTYCYF